jgi:ferredoxin
MIIDGREVEAFPGETILQTARRENIFIPSLCFSDATEPTNACRLCMVEIAEGSRTRLVVSCAYPAKDGLTVTTDTEELRKLRSTLLKLMYSQAPENPVIVDLMKHVDLSGRPYAALDMKLFGREIGGMPPDLFDHFLESFAFAAKANLHVKTLSGINDHHKVEACFKALARALDAATRIDPRRGGDVPSTKGTL